MWIASFLLFFYVLAQLWIMAASALRIKDLKGISHLFKLNTFSLQMILLLVVGTWLFFPAAILAYKAGVLTLFQSEALLVRVNFCAKVSHTSCQTSMLKMALC